MLFITNKTQKGFSIIELLVALGISAVIITSIVGLLVQSLKYTRWSEHNWQATSFGEGAIEAAVSIKENDWDTIAGYSTDGTIYHPAEASGEWSMIAGSDSWDMYTRSVQFFEVCRDTNNEIEPCGGGSTIDPDTRLVQVDVSWTEDGQARTSTLQEYLTNWEVCYAVWPYTYGTNYNYNTGKIEVTGGQATLLDRDAEEISNGDFQTGDFTDWTVQGSAWQVSDEGGGNYVATTEADDTQIGSMRSQNFASAGQQLRFRHKGYGQLVQDEPTGYFVDDDQVDFDAGSYVKTQYDTGDGFVELNNGGLNSGSGEYTSDVHDVGSSKGWSAFAWTPKRPYLKQLPDNADTESGYSEGNVSMGGNALLMHMNDQAGDIIDMSGNSNDGTAYNVNYNEQGVFNSAIGFDSVNDYVSVPDDPSLDITTEGTLEAWVYINSFNDYAGIIHKGELSNFSDEAYSLQFWNNRRLVISLNNGAPYLVGNDQLTANEWTHVVGVWDEDGLRLYINGELDNSSGSSGVAINSPGSLTIGKQFPANAYNLDGRIDEAAIYGRALSPEEISDRYKRGGLRLKYQVRSCDDPVCDTENFVGPDGTDTSYYSELMNSAATIPSIALSNVSNNQYFQYKAFLETENESFSPEFSRVTAGNFDPQGDGNNYVAVFRASNNEQLIKVNAPNNPLWQDVVLDLSAFPNEQVYIKAVDNSVDATEGWYAVDDFRQTDSDGNILSGYASDSPVIITDVPKEVTDLENWYSFAATTYSEANSSVTFQVSPDGGTTWYYWDGVGWNSDEASSSTENQIKNNISTLPGGNSLSIKTFLNSNGDDVASIDKVLVSYEGDCAGSTINFSENFESGALSGWQGDPVWGDLTDWQVTSLGGSQVANNYTGNHNVIFKGDTSWSNYTYTGKVRRFVGLPAGLVFYYQDSDNFWRYWTESGRMLIRGRVDGSWTNAGGLGNSAFPIDDVPWDTWYWFKVQVDGDIIRTKHWADGTAEPGTWETEINEPRISNGAIGLVGWGGAWFDDLNVE